MGTHFLSVQIIVNDVVIFRPDGHSLIDNSIFGLIIAPDCRNYWGTSVFALYGIHKLGGAASSAADLTVIVS
jgi:hypothetical protein